MATPAQIAANQLNAQKSTGPRSVEGKAASRFNALKHAATAQSLIIPGEDQDALAELSASYYDHFQPIGPEEALLVEKIVAADWTQRRMSRLEAQVLNALIAQQDESQEFPLGAAFLQDCHGSKALTLIFRRREAAGREWFRATKELYQLQADRPAIPPPPPSPVRLAAPPIPRPEPAPPAVPSSSQAKIGFVFDATTPPAWRL